VAALAIGLIVLNAIMKAARDYLASLLSIVWRKYLTHHIHTMYFENKQFYYLHNAQAVVTPSQSPPQPQSSPVNAAEVRLDVEKNEPSGNTRSIVINNRRGTINSNEQQLSSPVNYESTAAILDHTAARSTRDSNESSHGKVIGSLDNPDQRITQDVNSLCASLSTIVPIVLITPFLIGWYGYMVRKRASFIYSSLLIFFNCLLCRLTFRWASPARCLFLSTLCSGCW
jgi:hypothetical protein